MFSRNSVVHPLGLASRQRKANGLISSAAQQSERTLQIPGPISQHQSQRCRMYGSTAATLQWAKAMRNHPAAAYRACAAKPKCSFSLFMFTKRYLPRKKLVGGARLGPNHTATATATATAKQQERLDRLCLTTSMSQKR